MTDRFLQKTYRIIEATKASEYVALSDANKDAYRIIISAGIVDFSEDSNVRKALWSMFEEGTDTRAALEALYPSEVEEE